MGELVQGPMAAEKPVVLVVDDDPLQRREIVRCLSDMGIRTHEESDGNGAVSAVISMRPPVVIMDIRMPVMDGIDAVKTLDKNDDYMPKVILITGDPESLYRGNRMGLNVHSVLEKPVPLRHLSKFVLAALGR